MSDQTQKLLELYDNLRSAAVILSRGFRDRGDHYEFVGSMNDVEWLREAVGNVEGFMCEHNIPIPGERR